MKKILGGVALALALAPLAPAVQAGETASPQPLAIKVAKVALFDVARFDEKLVAVGERGLVMQSTDEGKTWSGALASTSRTLNTVLYLGNKVGLAAGHGGTMLRTEDLGATWKAIKIESIGTDSILGLSKLSDGRVIACGAFGMYLESADMGKSWVRKSIIKEDFERHISSITDIGGGKLFLVGETGTLAISHDMGATWKELVSPYEGEGSFFGVLRMTDGALLIYGMRGRVYRSTDEGATWTRIEIPSVISFNGGSMADDGRVVLAGNGGLIATSSDNGKTFTLHFTKDVQNLGQALYAKDGAIIHVGFLSNGRFDASAQKP